MGLDMYLEGRKYLFTDWKDDSNNPKEDGFRLKEKVLELGYWRKHPNLHGFIVKTFADGKDECQDIELSKEDLEKILEAVRADALPKTNGFFFGTSDGPNDQDTIGQVSKAIEWLAGREQNESRSVVYRASW